MLDEHQKEKMWYYWTQLQQSSWKSPETMEANKHHRYVKIPTNLTKHIHIARDMLLTLLLSSISKTTIPNICRGKNRLLARYAKTNHTSTSTISYTNSRTDGRQRSGGNNNTNTHALHASINNASLCASQHHGIIHTLLVRQKPTLSPLTHQKFTPTY